MTTIPTELIHGVRAAADIVEVIGSRCSLGGEARFVHGGACPFHADDRAELQIDARQGWFRCPGCWAEGDAIDFVERFDEVSYAEALRRVAAACDVEIPEGMGDERPPRTRSLVEPGMPALRITRAGRLVGVLVYSGQVLKLGRLRSSHVVLDDPQVARMHAVIEARADGFRVHDLGGAVGTYLNGEWVDKNAVVKVGDRLRLGEHEVELVAVLVPETDAHEREAAQASARMCLDAAEQAIREQRLADVSAALEVAAAHVWDPALERIVRPTAARGGAKQGWLDAAGLAQLFRIRRALIDEREDIEAAMVADILLAPDDDAPRLVYADWLQQQGDARGELIALQIADARGALDERGHLRLDELIATHGERWSAEFATLGAELELRRGFPALVRYPGKWSLELIALVRRWPTIERVEGRWIPDVLADLA